MDEATTSQDQTSTDTPEKKVKYPQSLTHPEYVYKKDRVLPPDAVERVRGQSREIGAPEDFIGRRGKQGLRNFTVAPGRLTGSKTLSVKIKTNLELFLRAFLKTEGNLTKAAMLAFNLKSKMYASQIGTEYYKKARELGRIYMEDQNVTLGKVLEKIWEKVDKTDDPGWMDRLLHMLGLADFGGWDKKANTSVINLIKITQDKMQKEYGFGDLEEVIEGDIEEDSLEEEILEQPNNEWVKVEGIAI